MGAVLARRWSPRLLDSRRPSSTEVCIRRIKLVMCHSFWTPRTVNGAIYRSVYRDTGLRKALLTI